MLIRKKHDAAIEKEKKVNVFIIQNISLE